MYVSQALRSRRDLAIIFFSFSCFRNESNKRRDMHRQQQNILQFSYTELFSSIKLRLRLERSSRSLWAFYSLLSYTHSLTHSLAGRRSSLLIFNWFQEFQILLAKGVRTSLVVNIAWFVSWVEFIKNSSRLSFILSKLKNRVVCHVYRMTFNGEKKIQFSIFVCDFSTPFKVENFFFWCVFVFQ